MLFRDDEPLELRPKSFDVLRHLAANPGRVISRRELLDQVWADVIVTDDSLTQCLIEIRKVLGDEDKSLIKTIPRRGYLFDLPPETTGTTDSKPRPRNHDRPSRWTMIGLSVLAIAIVLIWWRLDNQEEPGSATTVWQPPPASIAVLPFVDMSEQGNRQYLAEGISEEILNLLAQSPKLTVIARTSSFQFRDGGHDISDIARELNVAHILEGSVRLDGERVRVTAQLVEGDTEAHVWSQTYDDQLSDVFAMQDRVASAVAALLKVELTATDSETEYSAHTAKPEAWEAYSRGRLYYSRRSEGDILRAQASFEEALEVDPGFADAWVSLSATLALRAALSSLKENERLTSSEVTPRVRESLETALVINPNHPEALWRFARLTWRSDLEKTLGLMSRSAELGHNDAMVQAMMGGWMLSREDPDLAIPFLERATTLDPLSAAHQSSLAHSLLLAGRLPEAERVLNRAVELSPADSDEQLTQLAWTYIRLEDEARAAEFAEMLPAGTDRELTLIGLHHLSRNKDEVSRALNRLLEFPPEESAPSLAQAFAMLNERNEAFRWLEIATENIAGFTTEFEIKREITKLQFSPFMRVLHDDERWLKWVAHVRATFWNELDIRVINMLKNHLVQHPEIYGPTTKSVDLE